VRNKKQAYYNACGNSPEKHKLQITYDRMFVFCGPQPGSVNAVFPAQSGIPHNKKDKLKTNAVLVQTRMRRPDMWPAVLERGIMC